MKKSIKKLIAIFLVTSITIFSSSIAFALESSSQKISVLPEQKIFDFIEEQYSNSDPACQWTSDTIIKETIPTYDLDNNINGYILNLSTDGINTGYMVYDISSDEPILIEFGYNGVYSIQGEEVTQESELGQSKLVPVGMNEWVLQDSNDIYTIKTHKKITDQKEEIQKSIEKKEENIAQYIQSEQMQMASKLSTPNQEIYSSVSLPNLWKSGYQPVTMQMYGNQGCAVVCGLNMLKYWLGVNMKKLLVIIPAFNPEFDSYTF